MFYSFRTISVGQQWRNDLQIASGFTASTASNTHPIISSRWGWCKFPSGVNLGFSRLIHLVQARQIWRLILPLMLWSSGCNRQVVFGGNVLTTTLFSSSAAAHSGLWWNETLSIVNIHGVSSGTLRCGKKTSSIHFCITRPSLYAFCCPQWYKKRPRESTYFSINGWFGDWFKNNQWRKELAQ